MSTFQLEVRFITAKDLSAVLELDQASFGGLWTLEAYQRELDSPNSDLLGLFSVVTHPQLVGMGCFWSILDEAHITILAVHPNYKNQGLGQALLYFLLRTAYLRGMERATLEVRSSNAVAITLYEKFGFKSAGKRRRYYKDNNEDALILWLGDVQQAHFQKQLVQWHTIVSDRLSKSGWSIVDRL